MIHPKNRDIVGFLTDYMFKIRSIFDRTVFVEKFHDTYFEIRSVNLPNNIGLELSYPEEFINNSDSSKVNLNRRSQGEMHIRFTLAEFFCSLYYNREFAKNKKKLTVAELSVLLGLGERTTYNNLEKILDKIYIEYIDVLDLDESIQIKLKNDMNEAKVSSQSRKFISSQLENYGRNSQQ